MAPPHTGREQIACDEAGDSKRLARITIVTGALSGFADRFLLFC